MIALTNLTTLDPERFPGNFCPPYLGSILKIFLSFADIP